MPSLQERGWRLAVEPTGTGPKTPEASVLSTDLKEVGQAWLSDWLATEHEDAGRQWLTVPETGLVLQVVRVRNVAAPKVKEDTAAGTKLHRITLTDGHAHGQAIELRRLDQIGTRTIPGTKIRLLPQKRIQAKGGFLLLEPQHLEILGGRVPALADKWEISQKLAHFTRAPQSREDGGPPPWVPFGRPIRALPQLNGVGEADFKAMPEVIETANGTKEDEFDSQRQGAIEEAAKQGGGKKVFGGGKKEIKTGERRPPRSATGRGRGRRGARDDDYEDPSQPRPSTGVSLFAFVEKEFPDSAMTVPGPKRGGEARPAPREEPGRRPRVPTQSQEPPRTPRHEHYSDTNGGRRDGGRAPGDDSFRGRGAARRRGGFGESAPQPRPAPNSEVAPRHARNTGRGGGRSQVGRGMGPGRARHEPEGMGRPPPRDGQRRNMRPTPQDDRDFGEWNNSNYRPAGPPPPASHMMGPRRAMNEATPVPFGSWDGSREPPPPRQRTWQEGEMCLAKYWEDDTFYPAQIIILSASTAVVLFQEYGNHEEVLLRDLKLFSRT